jgi:hypothetical protein
MNINEQRKKIKEILLRRIGRCQKPDCQFTGVAGHLHEGLVTRADIKGIKDSEVNEWVLTNPINLFILHPHCHIPNPPTRKECYKIAIKLYGEKKVDEFYERFRQWKREGKIKTSFPPPIE